MDPQARPATCGRGGGPLPGAHRSRPFCSRLSCLSSGGGAVIKCRENINAATKQPDSGRNLATLTGKQPPAPLQASTRPQYSPPRLPRRLRHVFRPLLYQTPYYVHTAAIKRGTGGSQAIDSQPFANNPLRFLRRGLYVSCSVSAPCSPPLLSPCRPGCIGPSGKTGNKRPGRRALARSPPEPAVL